MRRVFAAFHVVAVLAAGPVVAAGLDLVAVPAGTVEIGDPAGGADETPHPVAVAAFRLMRREVTNAAFAAFAAAAGNRTDAEENGFGWVWSGRWRRVAGTDWRHPSGPDSTIADRDDHPVVQVSARDATAFCAFHGLRLPSEAEWERAARGPQWRRYPWGDASPKAGGARRANFGSLRCCAADAADGYLTTAPVGRFPAGVSPYGIEDMAGNVWEWTASHPERAPERVILKGGGWGNNPYCLRIGYRHTNPPDIGLDMVGFRCAGNVE